MSRDIWKVRLNQQIFQVDFVLFNYSIFDTYDPTFCHFFMNLIQN